MSKIEQFQAVIDKLHELLVAYSEWRNREYQARLDDIDHDGLSGRERNLIEGLNIAYREARRLELPTDPTPLLKALDPDDNDDNAHLNASLTTLLALRLDADIRRDDTHD